MEIAEILTEIRTDAMRLNMEVDEYLEWLRTENNKRLPWEE